MMQNEKQTILAIDSSGTVASAAVLRGDRVLSEFTTDGLKKHSTTLLPMIGEALRAAAVGTEELTAIAVSAGPGSFTGLRIGSSTAKGLALALGIPIIPVPTLSTLAYNLAGTDALVCPIMDARREQVYTALFSFDRYGTTGDVSELPLLAEHLTPRAIYVRDLIAQLNEANMGCACSREPNILRTPQKRICGRVVFLGDGVPVFRKEIEETLAMPHSFAPPHLSRQRASSVGVLGSLLFREGVMQSAEEHRPFYLRKSQAEQQKERGELKETNLLGEDAS